MMLALAIAVAVGDIEILIERLAHPDIETREQATAALRDAGRTAFPALVEAAGSGDPEVSARAASLLAGLDLRLPAQEALSLSLRRDGAEWILAARNRSSSTLLVVPSRFFIAVEAERAVVLTGPVGSRDPACRLPPGDVLELRFSVAVRTGTPVTLKLEPRYGSPPTPARSAIYALEGDAWGDVAELTVPASTPQSE
jgi:hypothetical protein